MPKINCNEDFEKIIKQINSFSHAYILSTNNLSKTIDYAKNFAKSIILEQINNEEEKNDISYKIDKNIFDDLYIVDPDTLSINNEEISKLLKYMETKSIRENGRRVYIINGIERIARDISNKILKFLEEPEEGIYALLLTSEIDKVLPTITSRSQIIDLKFDNNDNLDEIKRVNEFLNILLSKREKTIAYTNEILRDIISNREIVYQYFEIIENIISNSINKKNNLIINESYGNENLDKFDIIILINILDITNRLKQLIKKNININLLLDRYIIEVGKELKKC